MQIRKKNELANPILAYLVIAVALICGMVVANAMGVEPTTRPTSQAISGSVSSRLIPTNDANYRRWVLGVRAEATEAGYLVRFVQPGSSAHRIGLEKGDRVIAVDGEQIGYVGSRLVPMSETLDRNGGEDGRVRLLVQNHRNRRLVSLRATLRSPIQILGH